MLGKDTQAPPKLEGRRPRVPSSASSDATETSSACSDGEINGEELKMVIAVRMDLQMGKGKIAAQCCHAAVRSYQKLCTPTGDSASDAYWDRVRDAWENGGQRKVVVKVPNEEVLNEVVAAGREAGLLVSTIRDAGRTQIAAGSKTVAAFGPGPESAIDEVKPVERLLSLAEPQVLAMAERQLSTATVHYESLSPTVLTSRVAALDDAFGWLVDHLPTVRPLLCLIKGEYDSCIRRLCRSLEVAALAANRLDLLDVEMAVKLEHVRSQHDSVVEELKAQLEKLGAKEKDMSELVGQRGEELKMKDSELERLRREKYQQHRQNYDLVKGHNRLMAELTATAEREQNVASECIRLSHEVKHHEQQARSTEEQIEVLNDKISSMVTAEVHSRLVEEKNVALRELEDIRKNGWGDGPSPCGPVPSSITAVDCRLASEVLVLSDICRPLTPRPVWEDAAGVVDWQLEAAEDSDICRPDDDDHDQPQSAAGADMMHLVASVSRMSSLSLGRTLLSELQRREAEGLRVMHAYGGAAALLGCRILGHYKAILEGGPPTARSGLRPFQDIAGELQPWGEPLTATVLNTAVSTLARELAEDGTLGLSDEEVIVMISEFATDEPPSSCCNMSLSTASVWEFLYGVATIYASRQNHESTFVAAILKALVKQSSVYSGSSGLLDRWNLTMAECLRNSSGTASTRTMKDTWEVLQSSLWSLVLSIMFVVRREVISMTGVTPLMLAMTMLIREEVYQGARLSRGKLPDNSMGADG
ncbi:Gluconate transport-inducing protein [Perkinsus olseni]|uniref:peptidyl-tRNA hydrolase n=1 Tax=Perkinsus olseni TaxID=32597 RepID=A0A7J6N8S7_PEROL|nr:Gluconate transport-inducing protein [Perkinsus olseni]